ncbi:hypothetical protein vseg_015879 [Gypsophila vaccaria]
MLSFLKRSDVRRVIHQPLRFSSTAFGQGRLENKVALITGGAKGIGRTTAQEFIRQGAKVIIADIDDIQGPKLAQELGPQAQFIRCDVGDETNVAQAIDTAVAHHGKLDILYNNAGIVGNPQNIVDLDLDHFDRVMRVNVRGVMAGIKHASRVMIPTRSGSILCTASICGIMGGFGPHSYSISKFTVAGIVKTLASELCQHGVRINCISPATVATQMAVDEIQKMYPKASQEQLKVIIDGLGNLKGASCDEIDIAKAAVYLGSDDAKYVSGHNLVVDGGATSFKTLDFPPPDQYM